MKIYTYFRFLNWLYFMKSVFKYSDPLQNFIEDGISTDLDDLDYDELYNIKTENDAGFITFKSIVKNNLKPNYKSFLEIGAGTGGFTIPFLRNSKIETAFITDISKKMLHITRSKINNEKNISSKIYYATYTGMENVFKKNKFEIIIGTSVLHHMPDYKSALMNIYKILTPNGTAIFLEPDIDGHKYIIKFLESILDEVRLSPSFLNQPDDFVRLTNWIYEVKFNIKYSGHLKFLIDREDKHMFNKTQMIITGKNIGFKNTEIISDPVSFGSVLDVYLNQARVSQISINYIKSLYELKKGEFLDFDFESSTMFMIFKKGH
jgi:ubiquinone/menaquinone biosynthesis C-methylase UbiE